MSQLLGHSITYRIAVGPQQGRKVFTLQTLPACDADDLFADIVGKTAGFSLHTGVAVKARERDKLERLCRYITSPAVSEKRLSLANQGKVRYELKTPYRDGTTHVIFEPLDFIAGLAALVPRPRVNLTRYPRGLRTQATVCGNTSTVVGRYKKQPGKRTFKTYVFSYVAGRVMVGGLSSCEFPRSSPLLGNKRTKLQRCSRNKAYVSFAFESGPRFL